MKQDQKEVACQINQMLEPEQKLTLDPALDVIKKSIHLREEAEQESENLH